MLLASTKDTAMVAARGAPALVIALLAAKMGEKGMPATIAGPANIIQKIYGQGPRDEATFAGIYMAHRSGFGHKTIGTILAGKSAKVDLIIRFGHAEIKDAIIDALNHLGKPFRFINNSNGERNAVKGELIMPDIFIVADTSRIQGETGIALSADFAMGIAPLSGYVEVNLVPGRIIKPQNVILARGGQGMNGSFELDEIAFSHNIDGGVGFALIGRSETGPYMKKSRHSLVQLAAGKGAGVELFQPKPEIVIPPILGC